MIFDFILGAPSPCIASVSVNVSEEGEPYEACDNGRLKVDPFCVNEIADAERLWGLPLVDTEKGLTDDW